MRKPREIWVMFEGDPAGDMLERRRLVAPWKIDPMSPSDEIVHYREVLPRERPLSIDDLSKAYLAAYKHPTNRDKNIDLIFFIALVEQLFGEQ